MLGKDLLPNRICLFSAAVVPDSGLVTNYDPMLPVAFHCSQCRKSFRLKGEEAANQTPAALLPGFLSFKCPGCQALLKADLNQAHWVSDASGRQSVFVLDRIQMA